MNIQRIQIVLLHTWYHLTHSLETWVDLVFNSIVQMLVFSFLAFSINTSGNTGAGNAMIIGMLFWNVLWVAQYGICVGTLWEIWSKSFGTIFISPLTLSEFLTGQMISTILKALLAFFFMSIVSYVIFAFNPIVFGLFGVIIFIELLIFGWGVGMMVLSLIFLRGIDVQSLSWFLVFLIQPIGGIFYPVEILPESIRWISYLLPTSYIFNALRMHIATGVVPTQEILKSGIMSCIWFIVGYGVITYCFSYAKQKGLLARMLT
jgi:ABC-2 type transport system permease protein